MADGRYTYPKMSMPLASGMGMNAPSSPISKSNTSIGDAFRQLTSTMPTNPDTAHLSALFPTHEVTS
ncbi:hypothetical protein BFP76_00700 [Amylibacter kogurei]|uniref:Uncharacterized protein n=1 Tax=Paramylibacter kogurei TaxID=1889778 RepID=A0A2G5K824_9RHOB|nr:hypothetical protein BFP76_00700 [Amylibacter kogurei]